MAAGDFTGGHTVKAYRARDWHRRDQQTADCAVSGCCADRACASAIELTIDAIARAVGREPYEVRLDNLVTPAMMPYTSVTNKHFDSGDYPESLRRAASLVELQRRPRTTTPQRS